MNAGDLVTFLRSTDLLGGMHDDALRGVSSQLRALEVAEGTLLFEQGSAGDSAYLIFDGEIALIADGVELVRRGPGGIVGEFSLIDDQPRSASAVACTALELLVWERRAFLDCLASDPALARGILRVLTRKLRHDSERGVGLRIERDRWRYDLARSLEIQAGMLPAERLTIPGLEVAGHCAPVGMVGGDFYDVLAFDGERSALLIADVTGHGFYAGLAVAMTKSALHAQARFDAGPVQMMQAMGRTLALSQGWSIMMSCAYVLFDPAAGRLAYANAGHPYPLHVSARDGTVRPLEALDAVLGAQDPGEVRYDSRGASWQPGDTLVLYSDGVTEAGESSGDMFGRERLENALASMRHTGAAEIRDGLLAAVYAHAGADAPEDDVTLVVARATHAAPGRG